MDTTEPHRAAATLSPPMNGTAQACGHGDLLQLMWLASPALPIGGFSYSEVLESAIEERDLRKPADVGAWLQDQLHLVQARGDMAVVAQAIAAWRANDLDRVRALNAWVLQTRESSELRLQAEQMGRSMMDWLRNQHPMRASTPDGERERSGSPDAEPIPSARPEPVEGTCSRDATCNIEIPPLADMTSRTRACDPPSYPIAFALAASITQAPISDCLHSFAFGWAENMVQAAVKAVPLGQNAGQQILAALVRAIPGAVADALARDDDTRQAFAPMLSILSARHENQYSRLFRS